MLRVYDSLLLQCFDFLRKHFNLFFECAVFSAVPRDNELWNTDGYHDKHHKPIDVLVKTVKFFISWGASFMHSKPHLHVSVKQKMWTPRYNTALSPNESLGGISLQNSPGVFIFPLIYQKSV